MKRFKIFVGRDHYNRRPVYQVMDKVGDYVGEFHKSRKEAQAELKDLMRSIRKNPMKRKTRKKRIVRRKRRVVRRNPARTNKAHFGYAKMGMELLGTGLKIAKGERVYMTPATNIPGGGVFVEPAYRTGLWKQGSADDAILIAPKDFDDEITYVEPRGEYRPTPQVKPDYKYGIYTGRGIARNPSQYQNELLRLKRADARGYAFTKKFSSNQPQALDMLIFKLITLKGNRDENLVTFLIRKRAKYPRDYIVILKHRKYVDGKRLYSAGLKAETAIGQFATILGAKAKRVGQSDYVFTTYGIRLPEERKKSSPGKLFGNPAKRDFYGDVYIGKKKVDTIFMRSVLGGSKKERELDVMDELLSMPNSYKLAWVKKPNGLYDVKKGFRVRET